MKITAALLLLLAVAQGASVRRLNHHGGKSVKDVASSGGGKSGKSESRPESSGKSATEVEVQTASISVSGKSRKSESDDDDDDDESMSMVVHVSSKSGKSESDDDDDDDTAKVEVESISVSGKSGKSESRPVALLSDDDESMSMAVHVRTGKADKGADHPIAADGKAGKAGLELSMSVPQANGKADKPLTNFFIKTSEPSSKAGKSEHLETLHIETTTVTYVGVEDVEMAKPKSGKADGYTGKADKPSGGAGTSSSSKSDKTVSSPAASSSKAAKNDMTEDATATPSTAPLDSKAPTTTSQTASTSQAATTTAVASTAAASSSTAQSIISTTFANGEPPTDDTLLTLAPTPTTGSQPRDDSLTVPTQTPTYVPTSSGNETTSYDRISNAVESSIAIQPFALNFLSSSSLDIETVRKVTAEHLIHSFRNYNPNKYTFNRLKLMILQDPDDTNAVRRYLEEQQKIYFGGILYCEGETPTSDVMDAVIRGSFKGARFDYYMNLLNEAGVVDAVVSLDEGGDAEEEVKSEKWKTASVGLAGAVGGLALLATGVHVAKRRRMGSSFIRGENDIEDGRFVIKLKDDAEVEEFPGINTVANTEVDSSTIDDRSVPSAIGDDVPSLNSTKSLDAIEQETYDPRISPLEEPPATTRYVSLFTVKKDVKGKTLDEIDLRALAINYLSKMLKKFPNTFLLPYDKEESSLPPITSIRGIPDDMEELERYVGNARVDENSGKVMFNLRVESDMPVSQMKSKKGAGVAPSSQKQQQCPSSNAADTSEDDNQETDGSAKGFEDITI